jgi:glycine/D-amino acid oxidase-like deaminating enzyme
MPEVPGTARAVIIGGGVSGCSVAYHLAALGWDEIVLLERKQPPGTRPGSSASCAAPRT